MQHDLYSWQVLGGEFVKDELTNSSEFIDKTITDWLKEVKPEQREKIKETLLEIINSQHTLFFKYQLVLSLTK